MYKLSWPPVHQPAPPPAAGAGLRASGPGLHSPRGGCCHIKPQMKGVGWDGAGQVFLDPELGERRQKEVGPSVPAA